MRYLPAILTLILALTSCEKSVVEGSDTSADDDQLSMLLATMDVNICRINLVESQVVSVIIESDGNRHVAIENATVEGEILIAVQPNDESGSMRIALGGKESALSAYGEKNPFGERSWIFHLTPSVDEEGNYTIMETDSTSFPAAQIIVETKPVLTPKDSTPRR